MSPPEGGAARGSAASTTTAAANDDAAAAGAAAPPPDDAAAAGAAGLPKGGDGDRDGDGGTVDGNALTRCCGGCLDLNHDGSLDSKDVALFVESLNLIGWNAFSMCLCLTLRLAIMEPLEDAPWVGPLFAPFGLHAAFAELFVLGVATCLAFAATTLAGHKIRSVRAIPPSSRAIFVLPLGALSGSFVDRCVVYSLSIIELTNWGPSATLWRAVFASGLSLCAVGALGAAARHNHNRGVIGAFFPAVASALTYPTSHAWNALLAADVYAATGLWQPGAADLALGSRVLKVAASSPYR